MTRFLLCCYIIFCNILPYSLNEKCDLKTDSLVNNLIFVDDVILIDGFHNKVQERLHICVSAVLKIRLGVSAKKFRVVMIRKSIFLSPSLNAFTPDTVDQHRYFGVIFNADDLSFIENFRGHCAKVNWLISAVKGIMKDNYRRYEIGGILWNAEV